MLVTAEMRFVQIVLLERDFQKTIDLLGESGWLELREHDEENEAIARRLKEKYKEQDLTLQSLDARIYSICDFLALERSEAKGELRDVAELETFFKHIQGLIEEKKERLDFLNEKKHELESGLKEIEQFRDLRVTRSDLERLNFLHFAMGSLGSRELVILEEQMKDRLAVMTLQKDLYILFTSKKGRWTLESELKKVHFKERPFPFEEDVIPGELFERIQLELQKINTEIHTIEQFKSEFVQSQEDAIEEAITSYNLQRVYHTIYQSIRHSGVTTIVEGWVQKKELPDLIDKLRNLLGDTMSIITWSPDELPDVKSGRLKVPTLMQNKGPLKAFEALIYNYGAPAYGAVDPTIFVAVSFLLLFGLMFGDMGQGLVIFLIGLAMRFVPSMKKVRAMAPLLMAVGISSIFFGYLYGAAFCFEYEQLEHILRPLNRTLFGHDKPYFIMISLHNIDSVLNLFLLTIGFGIVMNMVGMVINIVNNLKKKKFDEALLSRTGLAGFTIFLEVFIMFIMYFILKIKLPEFPLWIWIALAVSVGFVLLKEPLGSLITGHRPIFHHGVGFWVLHAMIEFIEIILQVMTNNLSFIRVGAFAFAHTLLSYVVLQLALTLGGIYTSPGSIAILIIGNLFIICLEGMIVSIQTIRLEYYEFFSKFFTEQGKTFIPFKIEKNRSKKN